MTNTDILVLVLIVWGVIGTIAAGTERDGYRAMALFVLWPVLLAWGLLAWGMRSIVRVVASVPALFRDASSW